ncbi:hypothetical protein ABIA85_006543 [Bradyrhizobium sp. LA6.10]
MVKCEELKQAYEAIFLAEFRGKIDRTERIARIIALRDSPLAAGFSFEERDAIANGAVSTVRRAGPAGNEDRTRTERHHRPVSRRAGR